MTSPLPPPWAAQVWLEGNQFHVDCPQGEGHPSHRLSFPADGYGMHRLRALLTNRNVHSMLGTKGDMTQHNVEKDIKLLKRKINPDIPRREAKPKGTFAPSMRQVARDVMRRLGL